MENKTRKGVLGSKENPVINLAEFMKVLNSKINNSKKKSSDKRISDDFFLFRGTASDRHKLVGRIAADIKNLKTPLLEGQNPVEFVEKEIFNNFMQRARIFQTILPNDLWEWIALARHHGVPTRILDWSRDPQIALWFAVQDKRSSMHEHSVVNIFHPTTDYKIQHGTKVFDTLSSNKFHNFRSPFNIDRIIYEKGKPIPPDVILYRPSSLNFRIDFQSSWFTVHPCYLNAKTNAYEYKALDNKKNKLKILDKIYINKHKKHFIRKELFRIGIDTATIYKDLDSIGKNITDRRFKFTDEVFTDEMMEPARIMHSFKEMQGLLKLYNSEQIENLHYVDIKGLYNKLIDILGNEKEKVYSIKTFNNMNRDFLSYKNQRELFLRLIEKNRVSNAHEGKTFDYTRIQFYNLFNDANYQKINIEGEKSTYKNKILHDNVLVFTDGLSKSHVQNSERCFKCKNCEKYINAVYDKELETLLSKENLGEEELKKLKKRTELLKRKVENYKCSDLTKKSTTKYLLLEKPEDGFFSFCLIETESKYYLSIELNHEYLDGIIAENQNMCFFFEFKDKSILKKNYGNDSLTNKYSEKFEYYNSKSCLTFDNAKEEIEKFVEKINEDLQIRIDNEAIHKDLKNNSEYIIIKHPVFEKYKSHKNKEILYDPYDNKFVDVTDNIAKYYRIPICNNDSNNRFKTTHAVLDYIFYKMRYKHPNCILREFSYGEKNDWYIKGSDGTVIQPKNYLEKITLFESNVKTGYQRYYYQEPVEQRFPLGHIYEFCYGDEFKSRVENEKNSRKK